LENYPKFRLPPPRFTQKKQIENVFVLKEQEEWSFFCGVIFFPSELIWSRKHLKIDGHPN
jgi:hypothetical protein